jgi:hypothetical protein
MLTPADVARRLALDDEAAAMELINSGVLPAVEIFPGTWRVLEADLGRFIAFRRRSGSPRLPTVIRGIR